MLINIEEIRNDSVLSRTLDFEKKGGGLLFRVFKISENYEGAKPESKYECHLATARQLMERVNFDMNYHWNRCATKGNRANYPVYQTDFKILDHSGIEIELEEFFGPFYDLNLNKPFVRGIIGNDTINSYFYFDEIEEVTNIVHMQQKINEYESKYPDGYGNFIYAFMEPPHSISTGKSIKDKGQYLLDFMEFFFSDYRNIEIMKWSSECSPYFNAGKEWWGTYFWTVFDPKNNWYIGICGSETD